MINKKEVLDYLMSKKIIFPLVMLAAGAGLGYLFTLVKAKQSTVAIHAIHESNQKYKYVNPLLAVDVGEQKDFFELKPFHDKVTGLIEKLKASGKADSIGLYFRDFKTGHWAGINENDKFFPGSLFKVYLMVAYYKEAESQPGILALKLQYDGKEDANALEYFKPSQNLEVGKSYTVEELIRRMIVYSDNNAANLLVLNINDSAFSEVYTDLGVNVPSPLTDTSDFLSPKQYSLFFRVLRNATYLNESFSEKAIELLTQVEFKDGIVAGLEPHTTVAHKFGEYFQNINGQGIHQLHDCGIVYKTSPPYLLCVMTKGKNSLDLADSIKQISALVFDQNQNGYK